MSNPFLSEIRIMSFAFPPQGWAQCDGQLLQINQNQALFSLLGTVYGGNGQTTFQLPDLRGRAPTHMGGTLDLGERAGELAHTLSIGELPTHLHTLSAATSDSDDVNPPGEMLAGFNNGYRGASNLVAIQPSTIASVGGSQAHENRQPFLAMNFCIALQGLFPSRN